MQKLNTEDKTDLFCTVFNELKSLGVKVPKIKKFKSSIPKQARSISAPSSSNKIFGISLCEQEKVFIEDYLLPKFIVTSTSYLKKFSEREIGLFRKAGSVARQRNLRTKLEKGEDIEKSEPNDVASLLKQWLRELPEPLIPAYLHDLFIRCLNIPVEDNKVTAILLCCHLLPVDHLCTLKHLLEFLSDIAKHCDKNKMGAYNLALIMAPNIFVMANDSIDKSCNGLVQQHTSVIELLINHSHRIGSPCSSSYLTESEVLRCCTDPDLSIDFPDYSPSKPKKKRKSGPVQDLFTGFKKLVGGQNSLSPNPKRSNQELSNFDTRSALKRKADDDHLPSMSPLKKQAIATSVVHNESSSTPDSNMVLKVTASTSEKSRKGHSRHRSFNLLKKREKKRQKCLKSSALDSTSIISTPNLFQENIVPSLQVTTENKESFMSPLSFSPINFDNLFIKTDFMKKSISDCYLTPGTEKLQTKIFSTSSEGSLPVEGITPSYGLRSATLANRTIKRKSDVITSEINSFTSSPKYDETDKENSSINLNEKGLVLKRSSTPRAVNSKDANRSLNESKVKRSPTPRAVNSKDANRSLNESKVKRSSTPRALSSKDANTLNESKVKRSPTPRATSSKDVNTLNESKVRRSPTPRASNSKSANESLNESEVSHILNCNENLNFLKVPDIIPQAITCAKSIENLKAGNATLEAAEKFTNHTNIFGSNIKDVNGVQNIALTQSNLASSTTSKLNNNETVRRNYSIRRQESFKIKPKVSKKSSLNQLKRADSIRILKSRNGRINNQSNTQNNTSVIDSKIIPKSDCKTTADVCNNSNTTTDYTPLNISNKKPTKRNVRNGSIVRGRPNTIRTGLPTDVSIRYSNDSFSSNTKHKTLSSSSSVDNDLFVNVAEKYQNDHDLSITQQIQNLSLSPEEIVPVKENNSKKEFLNCKYKTTIQSNDSKTEISNFDDKITTSDSITKTVTMSDFVEANTGNETSITSKVAKQKELDSVKTENSKSMPKRKGSERLSSNCDSKIHKAGKKSTKVSRNNSFPEHIDNTIKPRKVEKLRAVKSSSPRRLQENGVFDENTDKENHHDEKSQKQTHLNVKTPEDKGKSPEQWFSGRKFFEAQEHSQKEISDNKRESIAMILKNNPGHVRVKASLYDSRTRTSSNTTPMMLRSGTPYEKFCDSQSSQKKNISTKSTRSMRRNSPLPPPPKFVIPESSPISSYPLKEVTNLSNSEDIFFTPPTAQKSFNTSQNDEKSPRKKKKCSLKPKMNSYSGHTPHKLVVKRNKVSRSESSPFLMNVIDKTPNKPAEYLSVNSLTKCSSFNENYSASPVFKSRSSLSIERLKSNELLDEWNCEM